MSTRDTAATTRKIPVVSRGVFGVIRRELRRRSAIEPVIGHLKAEGHLGRCYLKGRRRRRQRRPLSRGPQLPPHPRLAEGFLAHPSDRSHRSQHRPARAQISFLTDDCRTGLARRHLRSSAGHLGRLCCRRRCRIACVLRFERLRGPTEVHFRPHNEWCALCLVIL